MDDLHAAFPGQTVLGRPHIAALLVQHGCIPSVSDGMRGLLGRGKAFYVPRYNIPLADSIRALRAAAQALRGTLTERERQSARDTRLVTTLCFSLSLLVTILLI